MGIEKAIQNTIDAHNENAEAAAPKGKYTDMERCTSAIIAAIQNNARILLEILKELRSCQQQPNAAQTSSTQTDKTSAES